MFFMATVVLFLSYDKSTGAIYELSHEYYPLFRGLFLICFFGACYGLVLFIWRRYKIDYKALFNVGREHNYHHVIRLSATLLSIVFLTFMLYIFSLTTKQSFFTPLKHLWPGIAVGGVLLRFFWCRSIQSEWNGRHQRISLLKAVCMVLLSPFSEAFFSRTFIADILTSMPKIFADMQFTSCLYITGDIFDGNKSSNSESCSTDNGTYKAIKIVLSLLPFWIRLMQCVRGFSDSFAMKHVANGFKYCMSMTVVALSFTAGKVPIWTVVSVASSLYAYWWDLHMDWGLGPGWIRRALHGKTLGGASKDCLLRPTRKYPTHWYYFAMVTNALARFGWAIYISPGQEVVEHHIVLLLGVVELLRRTQWSLFRLEWADLCRAPSSNGDPEPGTQLSLGEG